MSDLANEPGGLGGGVIVAALEQLPLRAWMLDRCGMVRWQNAAARSAVGDLRGRNWTVPLADPDNSDAVALVADILDSGQPIELNLDLLEEGRAVPAELSMVPLRDGDAVVGVLGITTVRETPPAGAPDLGADQFADKHDLTARQLEILQMLAAGKSTGQIADELYLSKTTVRNHIARLLAGLGVHTRVEAVVVATQTGLVHVPPLSPD